MSYGLECYFDNIESVLHLQFLKYLNCGNFIAAEEMIEKGFDINSKFNLEFYLNDGLRLREVTLFDLVYDKEILFDFMIINGYKVSKTYDNSLLMMARDCKPKFFKKRLRYLQEISTRDAQYLHYMVCCYGRYIKNIDLLSEKGITISEFGGCSLSHLISFKNDNFVREVKFNENKLIRKLIKGGADVNYNKYDTVLASTSTPLMNAVEIGDIGLVKYLIKYGADVTLTDQYGVRAKDIAIRQGNVKLIKLLNKYESPEYKAAREKEKNEFNIPEELVKFLKSDKNNRCIKFSNDSIVKNIEFYSYDDIVWFNYKKNKVIDLVSYVENFSTPMFVLNLKNNKVYGLDNAHDNFTLLADWDKFYKKMEYYVDGYIRDKFDK